MPRPQTSTLPGRATVDIYHTIYRAIHHAPYHRIHKAETQTKKKTAQVFYETTRLGSLGPESGRGYPRRREFPHYGRATGAAEWRGTASLPLRCGRKYIYHIIPCTVANPTHSPKPESKCTALCWEPLPTATATECVSRHGNAEVHGVRILSHVEMAHLLCECMAMLKYGVRILSHLEMAHLLCECMSMLRYMVFAS